MLNKDCVSQLNMANGISESQRQAVLRLFQDADNANVVELVGHYLASMNQDLNADWLEQKPAPPEIVKEKLPDEVDEVVDMMGIGGMFAYLNVLYQAHKNGGRHCIVTNPRDIFTFSGWTVHPEEDMDQRLIDMFQTKSLFVNEVRRILGLSGGAREHSLQGFQDRLRRHIGPGEGKPPGTDEEPEGRFAVFTSRTDRY